MIFVPFIYKSTASLKSEGSGGRRLRRLGIHDVEPKLMPAAADIELYELRNLAAPPTKNTAN